jgi:hypothetical protein
LWLSHEALLPFEGFGELDSKSPLRLSGIAREIHAVCARVTHAPEVDGDVSPVTRLLRSGTVTAIDFW